MQGVGSAGVDKVPVHVEHTAYALLVGIHLSVFLVVECLKLQHFAVLPVATLVVLGHVVQLRVER